MDYLNNTRMIQIAVAGLLVVGIVAGVLLVQRQQTLRSRATETTVATDAENSLSLVATSGQPQQAGAVVVSPGDDINVDVLLQANTNVNLVLASLKFPQALLEVRSINQTYSSLPADFSSSQGNRGWYYYFKRSGENPQPAEFGSASMQAKEWYGEADNNYWHAGRDTWMMLAKNHSTGGNNEIGVVYWRAPAAGRATMTVTEQRVEESGKGNGFEFGIGYASQLGQWITNQNSKTIQASEMAEKSLSITQDMQGNGDALVYYKDAKGRTFGDGARYSINIQFTPVSATAEPNITGSIIRRWLENSSDNAGGTVSLLGVISAPGYRSLPAQSGLVTKIIFKAKAGTAGQVARIEFDDSSTNVYKSSDGTTVAQPIKRPLEVRIVPPCPAAQACPTTTCHADSVRVPDGSCGETVCPGNAPAAGTCPTTCGQAATTMPDGRCGTVSCPATAACPTPIPTPEPPVTDRCSTNSVWNGVSCQPLSLFGETVYVGLDQPVSSRAELEEIERSFVRRSFPNFPEELFNPTSQRMGQQIQDIRLANFRRIGNDYERTWEFILNSGAKERLEQVRNDIGGTVQQVISKHIEAANSIWANSLPAINRRVTLKRVIIVNDSVVSQRNGGWRVVNDAGFNWWANDLMNNVRGTIPFDIDSRWVLDDGWDRFLREQPARYQGAKIDYGMIHELTHHLPVGDNYVYNMGSGHGFSMLQPNGKSAEFATNVISYMHNDHMTGSTSPKLTAPSSYYINMFWKANPKFIRTVHAGNAYNVSDHVYGQHIFDDSLTIRITGLSQAGIENCGYYYQENIGVPANVLLRVLPTTDGVTANFHAGECTIQINKNRQSDSFPGGYIGLIKGQAAFPFYIPRNLIETLKWKELLSDRNTNTYTFTIQATNNLQNAVNFYVNHLNSNNGRVDFGGAGAIISAYMDVITPSQMPPYVIAYGRIDNLNNYYILGFSYPR